MDKYETANIKPISARERDTIIAALRLWQEMNTPSGRRFYSGIDWESLTEIAENDNGPGYALDDNEIDILIEDKINR